MFPSDFECRMRCLLGGEFDAFQASFSLPRNVGLRLNPLKTKAPPDLADFGLTPVPWAQNGFYYDPSTRPGLSAYHDAGLYYLQEPSAMAPAGLLDVQPGMRVLDLCAAPGGKSTQLAAAMEGRGILVCNEFVPSRAQILARNLERLGVRNALVLSEHPQRLAERFIGWFDRILVDSPCSGEGMFRKEDAAGRDWSEAHVASCAARQLEILGSAARMLKPGGRLVYSTCTFAPAENEGAVAAFLMRHPGFSIVRADAPWFSPGRPSWAADSMPELAYTFRLWPHLLRGEGHYAAVLEKTVGETEACPEEPCQKTPEGLLELYKALGIDAPQGVQVSFGSSLYVAPEGLPLLRGLKVIRPGLAVAQEKKGRFEPEHALAMTLSAAASVAEISKEDPAALQYLQGNTLPGSQTGWTLVTVDGLSLGWAKGSGGILKNHLPKGLRRLG